MPYRHRTVVWYAVCGVNMQIGDTKTTHDGMI